MKPAEIAALLEEAAGTHGELCMPRTHGDGMVCDFRERARAAAASLREHGACNGDCQYARELRNRKTVEEMSWDELRELEAKENPPAPPAEPVAWACPVHLVENYFEPGVCPDNDVGGDCRTPLRPLKWADAAPAPDALEVLPSDVAAYRAAKGARHCARCRAISIEPSTTGCPGVTVTR